ncbi:MAG TPA: phosphatidate cytidylyltransferase, partial [Usitatibacter sp.]|nr:phosphatidate cytidylyltransferase [Usitatibacter sp.]
MLATRVITAVVALVVVVAMVFFASRALWSLFMLAVSLVCCWEWSRLSGLAAPGRAAFLALSFAIAAVLWAFQAAAEPGAFARLAFAVLAVATVFWIAVAPFWIAKHLRPAAPVAALAGWIVVWPTWAAG